MPVQAKAQYPPEQERSAQTKEQHLLEPGLHPEQGYWELVT